MSFKIEDSLDTTTSTLYPVLNFTSSIANTLEGSTMAIVMVAPTLATGMMRYFLAISIGISFRRDRSIL